MLLVSVLVIAFASGDEESFQTVVHTMFHEAAILIVPIFLPMFAFLHILERRFTRPIEVLALDQQTFIERMESDVEQGRRDMRTAVDERGTKPRYEIAELYESTNKMRRDMVGFIERLYSVTAERQRTAAELDVARQIQMSAVPYDFDSLTERFASISPASCARHVRWAATSTTCSRWASAAWPSSSATCRARAFPRRCS